MKEDVIILLLLGLIIYVAVAVYFISYSYQKAFIMYNAKLEKIYNAIHRKKNISLPHEINVDGTKNIKLSTPLP
jgi:uncharacterized protein (UPF0333 family)